jgi:hypothetical protein
MKNQTIPPQRPNLSHKDFNDVVAPLNIDRKKYPIVLVGKRDHYDTLVGGKQNNRNFYDDALMLSIVNKDGSHVFETYNFNTDPSIFRNATKDVKGIATLQKGLYFAHRLDWHKNRYLAVCQRVAPVNVTRDGQIGIDRSLFGINIHSGGNTNTHSEGCQTLPPVQYVLFMLSVLRYFGIDGTNCFADWLRPTRVERVAFDALLNKNIEMRQMVIPYLLY